MRSVVSRAQGNLVESFAKFLCGSTSYREPLAALVRDAAIATGAGHAFVSHSAPTRVHVGLFWFAGQGAKFGFRCYAPECIEVEEKVLGLSIRIERQRSTPGFGLSCQYECYNSHNAACEPSAKALAIVPRPTPLSSNECLAGKQGVSFLLLSTSTHQ